MKKEETVEDVLTLARQRTAQVFDRYDLPSVSFSGGKDSTVVLNLAIEEMNKRKEDGRLPKDYKLDVFFWDEEAIHPETIDYVRRVADLPDIRFRWLCVPIKHVNACSKQHPFWYCWDPDIKEKWCRELPHDAITELEGFERESHADSIGCLFPKKDMLTVGVLMGIRADESLRRFRSVSHRREDNWISNFHNGKRIAICKPIYDWNTLDVWTAPHQFGWDWNRAYDVMAKAGLRPHSQRVCHPFGQQPLQNLWMWRLCWPDLWERLCERVPGANTAMKYAKSPLYAAGGKATKREDESWEEAVAREMSLWNDKIQKQIAIRLRNEMIKHNRYHPGIPLPATVPHVDLVRGISSGLTWDFLLKIAIKGDIKNRLNPPLLGREWINEQREAAWGENWEEKYPSIAAKTFWSSKEGKWYTPEEAKELGLL